MHTPPAPAVSGSDVTIAFTTVGSEKPIAADLFVRVAGDSVYTRIAAEEQRGVYRAVVPGRFVTRGGFEYYLLVRVEGGGEITSPPRAPVENPHRVPVLSPAATTRIVILSPGEGEIVADSSSLEIAVLFDPPLEPGDSASLTIDGAVVPGEIERSVDFLSLRPKPVLSSGTHEAAAVLLSASGERGEKRWTFVFGKAAGMRPLGLTGRIEAGWALVRNADLAGDPVPFYDKTSSLAYDAYVAGDWRGLPFSASSSRDPIYDDEIRWAGRLTSEAFTLEVGDVYPSLSELTASWLTGKGALFAFRRGPVENTLFFVRSLPSDTSGGLGTYSQFVSGERLFLARGGWDLAAQGAYGWERESSVPESLRFLPPVRNLALSATAGFRLDRERQISIESGWSDTRGDDTSSAGGYRILATFLDSPSRRLSLEYHDYRPGFYALASPTVDGGEHGVIADASIRPAAFFRQTIKVESYGDRESAQRLLDGERILQLYGRSDLDWRAWGLDWNAYLLLRTNDVPYESGSYVSRYGTVGLYTRGKTETLSLSGTRSDTHAASRTKGWSANGSWSGSAGSGRFTWELGERYARSETTDDTTGTGTEGRVSDAKRWTLTAEGGVRAVSLEWRTSYQRIDEDDPVEGEHFTQHVLLAVAGRRF